MNPVVQVLSRVDRWVLFAWVGLVAIGLATVYSCSVVAEGYVEGLPSSIGRVTFYQQLVWVGVAALAGLVFVLIPLRLYETFAYVLYGGALAGLLAVFAFPARAGTHRWLGLGPLAVQPSELAKVAYLFALARFLSTRRTRPRWLTICGAMLLLLPPFLLVLKEPDLGTSLVFPALCLPLLYWSGVGGRFLLALASPFLGALVMFYGQNILGSTWPWVLYIVVLLVLVFFARMYTLQSMFLVGANLAMGLAIPFVWEKLQSYQQARILTFFKPQEADQLGTGYQVFQSKVAIGSGGILGKGLTHGTQKGLAFLPERHTDFIFSVVGEELGLLGALTVLGLFVLLIYRSLRLAVQVKRPFGSVLAVGVGTYFAFQALVNISITVGLLPVTGLPLPLISYGGSSMLASTLMVGLLLNASARWSEV